MAFTSNAFSHAFGTRFTDLSCGYNAYWRQLLPALALPAPDARGPKRGRLSWGEGPEIDTLTTLRMATQGLRVRIRMIYPPTIRIISTRWSPVSRLARSQAPRRSALCRS